LQLQLQVVPGRVRPVAAIDPDRVAIAQVLGGVVAAARQVDPADERQAAPGPVGGMDDQPG
jgi:hypothetical protein